MTSNSMRVFSGVRELFGSLPVCVCGGGLVYTNIRIYYSLLNWTPKTKAS